jgi:O-phosphoseryl-tRNA(Cys) synthetase
MYAIIWNKYIKDLVIAETEESARELLCDEEIGINAKDEDVKCVKLDDTLQTFTKNGIQSVREIIEQYGKPIYLLSIDDIRIQFSEVSAMNEEEALKLIKQVFDEKLKDGLLNLQVKWLIDQAEKVHPLEQRIENLLSVINSIRKEVEEHCTPAFSQHVSMISNRAREEN